MDSNINALLQLKSYYYRGQIIGDLIYLERQIDEFISKYLCDTEEKQKEIFELILANERMSFNSKIQVFEFLCKKHEKDFYNSNPDIFKDIKVLNDERNIVAHYFLDTSENGKRGFLENEKIGFIKFRNSTETLWRTNEDYLKYHGLLEKYIRTMENFFLEKGNNEP